jgi:hypothetical protein
MGTLPMGEKFKVQFSERGGTKLAPALKAWAPLNIISVDRSAYPDRFLRCIQNVVYVDELFCKFSLTDKIQSIRHPAHSRYLVQQLNFLNIKVASVIPVHVLHFYKCPC